MKTDWATRYPSLWEGLCKGVDSGRLAHAYLVIGAPRGEAMKFAEAFIQLLFCEAEEKPCGVCTPCRLIEAHKQVDVLWIEPQSKSREITAKEDVDRRLLPFLQKSSFAGGWKVAVLVAADRMNVAAANKLLKTLEEPPPKTLILLLSDSPQMLLPTILSRCQRLVLPTTGAQRVPFAELLELLQACPPSSGLEAARLAGMLKAISDQSQKGISSAIQEEEAEEALDEANRKKIIEARTNARLKEAQAEIFRTLLDWHRDLLLLVSGSDKQYLIFAEQSDALQQQAKHQTVSSVLQSIQAIEEMARRMDRNLPALQVFDEAFRKMIRPF